MDEKKYYVWRITTDWNDFSLLHKEFIENHRLRQGWGLNGMKVNEGFESFWSAWPKDWGDENACKKRYNILHPMTEIQEGDIIVIPKVDCSSSRTYPCSAFTLAKCVGSYQFDTSQLMHEDFGHYVSVEILQTIENGFNSDSLIIRKKFRAYQKAINRVNDSDFIQAVNHLIQMKEKGELSNSNQRNPLTIVSEECMKEKEAYLRQIIKSIRGWSGEQLEKIIQALFEQNGYTLLKKNFHDGQGGDVDLAFKCFPDDSLMDSLYSCSSDCTMPEICIQAKNKAGKDFDDLKGIAQLVKMRENFMNPILILINTADDFTTDTKNRASSENVILLNGMAFANLLVRHGLETNTKEQ